MADRLGRGLAVTVTLMLLLLLLAGCGPVEVRSAPPGTELEGLAVDDGALVLRLFVDNRNDVPMQLSSANLSLELDGQSIGARDWPLTLQIGARNREPIELRLPATGAALGLLGELESGERRSLPYRLEGRLAIDGQRDARIERDGFLHPVPGRPGRYR